MQTTLRLAILLATAAALAGPAAAMDRPRVSLGGVRNDPKGHVGAQLARAVCDRWECLPAAQIRRRGRIDFRLVKARGVSGVLFGTVSGARGGGSVTLVLLTTSLRPERSWVLPLDARGRIGRGALAGLVEDLRRELGGPAPAAAPAPGPATEPPAPTATAAPVPPEPGARASQLAPPPAGRARSEIGGTAAAEPARIPAALPAERPARAPAVAPGRSVVAAPTIAPRPRGVVDLGVHVTGRKLGYEGVGSGSATLQKFSATAIVSPCARVELYPLAWVTELWPANLALFASYGRSFGLETEPASSPGVRHDTILTQLEVGAAFRLRPFASSRASILPRVSYRTLSLEVKPAGGAPVAGLPNANLAGPSLGVDVEVPLGGRFDLLVSGGYTLWTKAKDLVDGDVAFFPSGSASAVDVSAGLALGLAGPMSLRLVAEYGRTRYSLEGTGPYVATGATDTYLGGRATLRARF